MGCAAVHLGANQPNKFRDAKSAEDGLPWYSNGERDDLMQRRFLEAHMEYWQHAANNPFSQLTAETMVDTNHLDIYAWDARPFPDFPYRADVWADAANWDYGHWLTGRVDLVSLAELLQELIVPQHAVLDVAKADGLLTGFVIDRPMALRDALAPLLDYFQIDVIESGETLRFQHRDTTGTEIIASDELINLGEALFLHTRSEEIELPSSIAFSFIDAGANYEAAIVELTDPAAQGKGLVRVQLPLVLETGEAERAARLWLNEARAYATQFQFNLPPTMLEVEPGDVITLQLPGQQVLVRVAEITDAESRMVNAYEVWPGLYSSQRGTDIRHLDNAKPIYAKPVAGMIDVPLLNDNQAVLRGFAYADPWPAASALYALSSQGVPQLRETFSAPAIYGRLISDFTPGPVWCFDQASTLRCSLSATSLQSVLPEALLQGANIAFVETQPDQWEVLQFATATQLSDGTWELSIFLRGQAGTEDLAALTAPGGSRIVLADSALLSLPVGDYPRGEHQIWRVGPAHLPPNDDRFREFSSPISASGLRPLSPVHLSVATTTNGFDIAWIRRTRIEGDDWAQEEVPLGEAQELYRLSIMSQGQIIHVAETSTPAYFYANTQFTADSAGLVSGQQVEVLVRQVSLQGGESIALSGILTTIA